MRILEVIVSRQWHHKQSGRTASIYGCAPWTDARKSGDWEIREVGWTWRLDNGTIGLGRVPAKTREEAEEVMARFNARTSEVRS